jgi:hypothetical protein
MLKKLWVLEHFEFQISRLGVSTCISFSQAMVHRNGFKKVWITGFQIRWGRSSAELPKGPIIWGGKAGPDERAFQCGAGFLPKSYIRRSLGIEENSWKAGCIRQGREGSVDTRCFSDVWLLYFWWLPPGGILCKGNLAALTCSVDLECCTSDLSLVSGGGEG